MKLISVYDIIRKFFVRTFTCFSLLTLFMAFMGLLNKSDELSKYMKVNQIFTFIIISLFVALSFLIADFIKNNAIIRRTVQFVLSYASFVGVFYFRGSLTNHVETNSHNFGFSLLALTFWFVIVYAVCAVFALAVAAVHKAAVGSEKEYVNIYKDVKKEDKN